MQMLATWLAALYTLPDGSTQQIFPRLVRDGNTLCGGHCLKGPRQFQHVRTLALRTATMMDRMASLLLSWPGV